MDARVRYHIFFSYVRLTLVSVCAVRCTMLMTYDFVPGLLCSVQLYHSRFTYAQLNEFVMKKKSQVSYGHTRSSVKWTRRQRAALIDLDLHGMRALPLSW